MYQYKVLLIRPDQTWYGQRSYHGIALPVRYSWCGPCTSVGLNNQSTALVGSFLLRSILSSHSIYLDFYGQVVWSNLPTRYDCSKISPLLLGCGSPDLVSVHCRRPGRHPVSSDCTSAREATRECRLYAIPASYRPHTRRITTPVTVADPGLLRLGAVPGACPPEKFSQYRREKQVL